MSRLCRIDLDEPNVVLVVVATVRAATIRETASMRD